MKLFEDANQPQQFQKDAAFLIASLFKETKEEPSVIASQMISPSGLACQVACAIKLQGLPTDPQAESFQSRSYANAGEDRHIRIQEFLSKTPYWVDVAKYVEEKQLPLEIVRHDGFEVLLQHKTLPIRFKCDGLLKIDDVYYILEIKTERGQDNVFRQSYNPKHQMQGITYTALLGTQHILWLYEGRDRLEQKCFTQTVTAEEQQTMLQYIQQIIDNKDKLELLQRNEKICNYCVYKKTCKAYFKEFRKRTYK